MALLFKIKFKKALIIFGMCLAFVANAQQQGDTIAVKEIEAKQKNVSFIPLPVISSNPTNGFMYGLAPGATWFMGDPTTTSVSSGLGSVIYTTNKQLILTAKTNIFTENDSWNFLGDWRYFITSQPNYGLGTGPSSNQVVDAGFEYEDNMWSAPIDGAQMLEFNYIRFHETAMKRYKDTRLFLGVGYHLDIHSNIQDNLLDLESETPVLTSHYLYNTAHGFSTTGYTMSGVSLSASYDSRDNTTNPYSGRYAYINFRMNPEWLGSDQGSTMLWAEYRDYINLDKNRPRHMLAFWTYASSVTSGNVPYLDLPALGWDQFGKSGRAYTKGRFMGEDLWYAEMEYRVPLQKIKDTFGAVAFVNATSASNRMNDVHLFDHVDIGAGVGLRIMINKKRKTNLTLDYAWGKYGARGFYLGINETF
ncbi:BamA/TamA family outer membrane protein [Saccharicrinis aurantiacus]|uniref:BamA/TamA family outer membrane protein n=1 Tax=Saccharicrinis aurantiacus TaxID=1849719 RepID=UPI002491ED1F|nr:BamA/TamA family outer membrane protein [Saccharicrinis aurantiacus]